MDVGAYGLSRNPFERNSELDESCLPNPLAVQLSELQAGLRAPQGVSVLVGEHGSGKSLLAKIFARRLAGHARAALSTAPGPSLADVLAESLSQLSGEEVATRDESQLLHELGILVQRRTRAGSVTAIVIDDAQRLSPQVLAGLTRLFPDDCEEDFHFHLFLIGRPELLDRMNASADRLLLEHLLQICRIEPLGLRDSVRYLERRLASCGGELGQLFEPEAIDEILAQANGRLLAIETLAGRAFENAARSGAVRVTTAHVDKTTPASSGTEAPVAHKQQSLRFEFSEDSPLDDAADDWEDEETDDEWVAGDEPCDDDPALSWETAAELPESSFEEEEDDEEERSPRWNPPPPPAPRRGLMAMAVLTGSVFVALTWVANRLPGESADPSSGRDTLLFAQPLTSQPREILRLAASSDQADAAAHVGVWNNVQAAALVAASLRESNSESQPKAARAEMSRRAQQRAREEADVVVDEPATASVAKTVSAKQHTPAKTVTEVVKPKTAQRAQTSLARKSSREPVYTVQIGAFRTRHNAQDLISKMGPRLSSARILYEGGLYRVVSGSFETKSAAAAHEGSLKRAGLTTYLRTAVF